MKVYLICPVRLADDSDTKFAFHYVRDLEAESISVYWPQRDTDQEDETGVHICLAVNEAIQSCDEVHLIWSDKSEGKLWDLAVAFAYKKPLILVAEVPFEEGKKSYASVVNHWPWGVEEWAGLSR